MQHEIKEASILLDEKGNIKEPGFAKKLLPIYDRSQIKAPKSRIKEWDYYLINNGHYALAATVDDNGYMGLDTVTFMDFDEGIKVAKDGFSIMPLGKVNLPGTSVTGDSHAKGKGYKIDITNDGNGVRVLEVYVDQIEKNEPLSAKITLTETGDESMVIATPFEKDGHFYYNQKINCLKAEGEVNYKGKTYIFDPEDSFGVLDWGRGVWTYHNTWYWGSASYQVDGIPFGWNIGYGFGDTKAATENMLFYNGKAHKLSHVQFNIPGNDGPSQPGCKDTVNTDEETRKKLMVNNKPNFSAPWTFTSDDGRFEMNFVPVLDRASCADALIIKSDQHQVFGKYSGKAILDDGTIIEVEDFPGFAEKVENKW